MAPKTTRREKREYKQLKKHLEAFEKKAEEQDRRELRMMSRRTGRDYFRFPDGRLASISDYGGIRVEMEDPETARIYARTIAEKFGRYDLKDGKIVENPDAPEIPKKIPEWKKARDYKPERTGEYVCMTESGFLKKKVAQQTIKYRHIMMGGEWITNGSTRVVYWLDE